jgi:hypothetical protein
MLIVGAALMVIAVRSSCPRNVMLLALLPSSASSAERQEIGPFLSIEQASLTQLPAERRTSVSPVQPGGFRHGTGST